MYGLLQPQGRRTAGKLGSEFPIGSKKESRLRGLHWESFWVRPESNSGAGILPRPYCNLRNSAFSRKPAWELLHRGSKRGNPSVGNASWTQKETPVEGSNSWPASAEPGKGLGGFHNILSGVQASPDISVECFRYPERESLKVSPPYPLGGGRVSETQLRCGLSRNPGRDLLLRGASSGPVAEVTQRP